MAKKKKKIGTPIDRMAANLRRAEQELKNFGSKGWQNGMSQDLAGTVQAALDQVAEVRRRFVKEMVPEDPTQPEEPDQAADTSDRRDLSYS